MVTAYLFIRTEEGAGDEVLQGIRKVAAVSRIYRLDREWDFLATIEAPDFQELGRLVVEEIRSVAGIAATRTLTKVAY